MDYFSLGQNSAPKPRRYAAPPPHPFPPPPPPPPPPPLSLPNEATQGKKKKPGARTWMRFDSRGVCELLECDRQTIMSRADIPARDLRILGPVFSHSSNILAREKAMVINLEFIKAVITAEEVFILDPRNSLVAPFVDQLTQQLALDQGAGSSGDAVAAGAAAGTMIDPRGPLWMRVEEESGDALPFEFQVLESALEFVCSYLDAKVTDLEHIAYPALDELTRNVSTGNLEHVRSLKSTLTHITARVRDEVEHLLDDDEDMADMYLSRKMALQQQLEALPLDDEASSLIMPHPSTRTATSVALGTLADGNDVEDLEMLLETCFLQIDGTRNRLVTLREYIDDTEDYINIQLDNHRNEMIQLQLVLIIGGFVISLATAVAGVFGMNIPYGINDESAFFMTTAGTLAASTIIFFLVYGYARWKELLA
ncbi:hypothetical protein SELMODRAFT_76370 [Selaginella moellendorffii]|uniref:Magnesium transporter n=1 Tax=Selaginella moellendorffii TaxID=88036 RepID=D8QT87_SELML|nr:hypothetical protein SELMODRAFT_76370 [Selaginella moellendorffii]